MPNVAAIRVGRYDGYDDWRMSDDNVEVSRKFDEDPDNVIWVETVDELVAALETLNPVPDDGMQRVRLEYGGRVAVSKEAEATTVSSISAAMEIAVARGVCTRVPVSYYVMHERQVLLARGKHQTLWEEGDFIFEMHRAGGHFVVYDPTRAKSLRTRRANAAKRGGKTRRVSKTPSMYDVRDLTEHITRDLSAMLPDGFFVDAGGWIPNNTRDGVIMRLVRACEAWVVMKRCRSYRYTGPFRDWVKTHAHRKRPSKPDAADSMFFDWFDKERDWLSKKTKKRSRR